MNAKRALFLWLSLAFAACDCSAIPGSGVSKTETRDVGTEYTRVQVGSGLKVTLTERDPGTVAITADDNLIPYITTTVEDGSLIVKVKDDGQLAPSTDVNVEVPSRPLHWVSASGAATVLSAGGLECEIVAIDTSGAAKVELDKALGKSLWVHASGASKVSVRKVAAGEGHIDASGASEISFGEGKLDALDLKASGASKIALGGVVTKTATLDVSGASDAKLQASEKVSGTASGASQVSVKGNPGSRDVGVSGGSDVQFD